ncbi:MAG: hypothetical protein A2Z58_04310 [Planctomycetes bacterium RIFCSPHIGHO2_12_42_15]|nr:MAG: hypothetical protein A2Z58_04310 [Planctomycetes bacterium RIFCSPHIGHO2_12_42_15]
MQLGNQCNLCLQFFYMAIRLTAIPAISSTILCQKYTTYCEYGNQAYNHKIFIQFGLDINAVEYIISTKFVKFFVWFVILLCKVFEEMFCNDFRC